MPFLLAKPVLVVDNLSPFTPDILECLGDLKVPYIHKKFSDVNSADLQASAKVILSGRRRYDREINRINSGIVKYCYNIRLPLLGICYGAEIIALTFGGSIQKMPLHVQGVTVVSLLKPSPLVPGKKEISVFESHRYCVARLPEGFGSAASSAECQHEIFGNSDKKMFGTQFHPEKSGVDGVFVLQNFVEL